MKITINKATNLEVYSQIPDFNPGMGIANAIARYGGTSSDYEELEVTDIQRLDYQPIRNTVSSVNSVYKPIIGCTNVTSLSTLTLASTRHYFIPFLSNIDVYINTFRINVTTNRNVNIKLGVYDNISNNNNDSPGNLLITSSNINTNVLGDITVNLTITLLSNTIYWICLGTSSSTQATVRSLAVGSIQTTLGWLPNSNNAVTHLYYVSSNQHLFDPAPAYSLLTSGTGSIPAIYYY